MTDIVPSDPDPWQRLESETAAEYAAFSEYCKLGPKRTLRMLSSHLGMSLETIKHYSKNNKWNDRAKALDVVANELSPTDIDMSPSETMAFQFAVGKVMLELGLKAVELKKPGSIKVSDAIKLIEKGAELQRKGLGLDQPGMMVMNFGKGFEGVEELFNTVVNEAIIDAQAIEEKDDDEEPIS